MFTDRNTLQQFSLFNYAIEKYNKDGDHDLKFISENIAKASSSDLKKISVPIPTDESHVPINDSDTYVINYEFIYYLNSSTEQSAEVVKDETPTHEEEEVIVEHGLLPKISHDIWSIHEIDYVSLYIRMIFSDIEMTKEYHT